MLLVTTKSLDQVCETKAESCRGLCPPAGARSACPLVKSRFAQLPVPVPHDNV